jgi:hypothetical protein
LSEWSATTKKSSGRDSLARCPLESVATLVSLARADGSAVVAKTRPSNAMMARFACM